MKILVGLGMLISLFSFITLKENDTFQRKEKLSEYGFFAGNLADLNPSEDVLIYNLNTPLFSNYAEKLRFIKLPKGSSARYNDSVTFDFPIGTIFIKNFYYPLDFRRPEKGRVILETRLLVRDQEDWIALPYIWNEEQTEAIYDPAGETRSISYVDATGKKITTPYVIPNKNQCKGCHIRNQIMVPIGPSARQLNRDMKYGNNTENQLSHWSSSGLLSGTPDRNAIPKLAVWNEQTSGSLNNRARAYLDANCGHCHNRLGPASTSGLFLDISEKDPAHLGVNKSPVAAGRGAGEFKFDIVPGQPHKSILVFRMNTNDPAIAMPEIGREQIHKEGLALIEEWIRKNDFK